MVHHRVIIAMAILGIVGFVGGVSAVTPVALGPVTVRADAARFTDIPALACDMKAAMSSRLKADPAEAIDWDEVRELYEMPGENTDISLQQFARGQIFTSAFWTGLLDNDVPEVWSTYQEYFNCSTWLDKRILEAIDDLEDELDVVRYEQAHKTSAFGTAVANALSLLEAAAYNAQAGDLNEAETLVGAAWAIIRGDDESASTYGCTVLSNADLRSEYFGVPGDVTEPLVAAFQSALSDLNADTTEALFLEAARAAIVTNLRSAIRYASRMDEAAAAGEADLVRESQFEGLTYLRVIAPLVEALDPESAAAIEAAFTQGADSGVGQFDLSGDPVLDDVVQAAERILEAAGVDVGSFGTYTENEPISG